MNKWVIGGGNGCSGKRREKRNKFLAWRDSRLWNIPSILIPNNLNGKTKSKKMVSSRLLLEEEDVMVAWSLAMQKHELFITLQLFKMKIAKLTQTIHTL